MNFFTEFSSLVLDHSPYASSNASSKNASMAAEGPTQNVIGHDSSQLNPISSSLRIFDEFSKIKKSMEMFPLPGNDVELGFLVSQTNEVTINEKSKGYGSRMTDLLVSISLKSDSNIQKLNELLEKAVEEFKHMVLENEPLWVYDEQKRTQVLNNFEYNKRFKELEMTLDNIIKVVAGVDMPSELTNADFNCSNSMSSIVATREIVFVSVPPLCIIEVMMDMRLWSFAFGDMLSRAIVLEGLVSGDPTIHDGVVQVMNVEYHGPSPLVPTRQCYFVRHCKQLTSNTWMVVDVPLDEIIPNPVTSFKRRPSGCLIEGLDHNGYSKVTWIEHVEHDNQVHVHPLLKPLVDSGFMFSAKRWVDTLTRQCQHLEAITQHNLSTLTSLGNMDHIAGLDGLLRLRDRMRRSFYGNLSGSSVHVWKPISIPGAQDVLIRTSEIENQSVVTLTINVTFWLPHKEERVFNFLQDERNRPTWDMIASGYRVDETFHLNGGRSPDRTISIIKMLDEDNTMVTTALLQETCYINPNESYVVYAPITIAQLFGVLDGKTDADEVSVTPSGFVIHQGGENVGGSVVSALFQLFDRNSSLDFVPLDSVHTSCGFVSDTLHAIRNSLSQLSSTQKP